MAPPCPQIVPLLDSSQEQAGRRCASRPSFSASPAVDVIVFLVHDRYPHHLLRRNRCSTLLLHCRLHKMLYLIQRIPMERALHIRNHLQLLQPPKEGCNQQTMHDRVPLFTAFDFPSAKMNRYNHCAGSNWFSSIMPDGLHGELALFQLCACRSKPCQFWHTTSIMFIGNDREPVTVVTVGCLAEGELVLYSSSKASSQRPGWRP